MRLTCIQQRAVNGINFNFKMLTKKKSTIENCRASTAYWQWIWRKKPTHLQQEKLITMEEKKKKKEKWNGDAAKQTNIKAILCADNRRQSLKLDRKNNGSRQKRIQWTMLVASKKNIFVKIADSEKSTARSSQPMDWLIRVLRTICLCRRRTTNSLFPRVVRFAGRCCFGEAHQQH